MGDGLPAVTAHRVCLWAGCVTILSRHNPGKCCWMHTEDKPRLPFVKSRRPVMDKEFIAGMPGSYAFTAAERRRYKQGG